MPPDPLPLAGAAEGSRELDALLATQTGLSRYQPPEKRRFSPELIAALYTAPGPSRIIDREIGYVMGVSQLAHDTTGGHGYPHYTASVDAALTLVPEGWGGMLGLRGEVTFWRQKYGDCMISADAKTLPLAICIAALSARAGKKETTDNG